VEGIPQKFKVSGDPANALAFEVVAVTDLFVIEQGVACVGDAGNVSGEAHLELFVEAAGLATLIVLNAGVDIAVDGDATAADIGREAEEGAKIALEEIGEGGAPVVDPGVGRLVVLGEHAAADGAIAGVVPGVEGGEETGVDEVVGVEDDEDLVAGGEMAPAIFQ